MNVRLCHALARADRRERKPINKRSRKIIARSAPGPVSGLIIVSEECHLSRLLDRPREQPTPC